MSVKKLLTLPPNLVKNFYKLCPEYKDSEWYCDSDPVDCKLGSGAGTARIVEQWQLNTGGEIRDKKIIIHAGGHSRRLPAYATSGKLLTPIPVLRWAWGERLDRNLLAMQLPLYEQLIYQAPDSLTTLIACGDMYIHTNCRNIPTPEADVVCYGMWVDASLASHHGVFMCKHNTPARLDFMLQKPTVTQLSKLGRTHYFLMDSGVWLLSDKAIRLLSEKSKDVQGDYRFYDLYSQFGCALGDNPSKPDNSLSELTVAIVPLTDSQFYHFGTTRELLSSTLSLQNLIYDQRLILRPDTKPNPALFTQNCIMDSRLSECNDNVWVENSHIATGWKLTQDNFVTGVQENNRHITK
ncbi:MAG: bifunctional fucokinase/L-fucose-1-P-guanylyltransferase, partial [Paramuribaculum sp.]|nr:bifunctional fucokinase/L-fucose-1-P-guanylyltransferase [Paramuribaculum sp.]